MFFWRHEGLNTQGETIVRPYYVEEPGFLERVWAAIRGRYLPPSVECKVEASMAIQLGEFSFCGFPVLQGGFYVPCGRIATKGCAYCDLHGTESR